MMRSALVRVGRRHRSFTTVFRVSVISKGHLHQSMVAFPVSCLHDRLTDNRAYRYGFDGVPQRFWVKTQVKLVAAALYAMAG